MIFLNSFFLFLAYAMSNSFGKKHRLKGKKVVSKIFESPKNSISIFPFKSFYSISTSKKEIEADYLIASADYAHVEAKLLEKKYRNYPLKYWEKKSFSPSSLLFYLGVSKKLKKLEHHTLFFDEDIEKHSDDIYEQPIWPEKPLFYTCCPAKTESKVAPKDKENLFILIPIAAGLKDSEKTRERYFNIVMNRLEKFCNLDIRQNIEYKKN